MSKLIIVASALMLTACGAEGARDPIVRNTIEVDGCQVKYIDPPNLPNFYVARCDNTTTTTWKQQTGKTSTTYGAINVESTADLRQRLADAEAREKALSKLSPEDKKALGIK